jgi:type VI secretion system (T6SS) phospholipase Tle1-like effector
MKHIVVCCDGTWNRADQARDGVPTPTNVRVFHNLLADTAQDGTRQVARYFSGVGADGSLLSRTFDGGTGRGLSRNIMNAYLWLANTYEPGDLISVVGFSRGAYTVRSLVAMLTSCGLAQIPAPGSGAPGGAWDVVRRVYEDGYVPGVARRDRAWHAGTVFFPDFGPPADAADRGALGARIEFLGVWDTVGSLGIPDFFGLLNLADDDAGYAFHDTHLNPGVRCARHAVALDERRGPFAPTLWTTPGGQSLQDADRVQQLWFPGCHSDVGGGYRESGLSDGALRWMIDEASAHTSLAFSSQAKEIQGDPFDVLHDSCVGPYQRISPTPRSVPRIRPESTRVHDSAVRRCLQPPARQDPYRPSVELESGHRHTAEIFAHLPWCETGLYVRDGCTYRLTACGEWIDKDEVAGPDGIDEPSFVGRMAYGLGAVADSIEVQLRTLTQNPLAELPLSKRFDGPGARWMQLVVVVANGGFDDAGNQLPHQVLGVGRGPRTLRVRGEGYLYAFANDAWGMYSNNRGSVQLTVERTA